MRWDKQKREDVKIFSWMVGKLEWSFLQSYGRCRFSGKDWAILSFRCLLDVHAGATRYPVVVQLLGHMWVRSLNPSGLEAHLRIQLYKTTKGADSARPLCQECPVCSGCFQMLLFSVSLSESFFLTPFFLNCGRQLCGRCIWKASILTGPEIAVS